MHYRLYFLSAHDHVMSARDLDCGHDEAALEAARALDDARIIEVWCGPRMVGRVAPPRPPGSDAG